jgi:hypothetical protein
MGKRIPYISKPTERNCPLKQFQVSHFAFKQKTPLGGCVQKSLGWPPGARTANGTALCH